MWSSNPIPGHVSGENHDLKEYRHPNMHKAWKQPKCPSTDEWIKKMWYICTMEYYSAIKKDEIMPLAAIWVDLEITILSEVSLIEKDKCHIVSHILNLKS